MMSRGCERKAKIETKKRNHLLKMCVTVKKSHYVISEILKDAGILLRINLQNEFLKAGLIGVKF